MAWYWVALILFGSALGLMMLGIPVAVGFFITNVLAAVLFMGGGAGIQQIINNGFGAMTNFALVPIPMFLFMGELFYHTGLATRCFNAADKLLGNIRGRLAYVTLTDFRQAERDVRSFDAPRWMVVGWIPLSFLMMAVEFARFLWRGEDFLTPLSELSSNT